MAELLGTVAAAVQLATCCSYLTKTFRSIRYASHAIHTYNRQLTELESTCQAIQSNSVLQTTEITTQIQAIITSTRHYIKKLGKSRLLRWPKYLVLRGEIAEFFRDLEGKKSSLALSILSVLALATHEIRRDVKDLRNMSPRDFPETEDKPASDPTSKAESQHQQTKGSPDKVVIQGQEHNGHGRMIVGTALHRNVDGLANVMANHEYRDNKKVVKKEANKCKPGNSMVTGVVFGKGAKPQRYTGLWEKNVMEDDGEMVCGTVVEEGE